MANIGRLLLFGAGAYALATGVERLQSAVPGQLLRLRSDWLSRRDGDPVGRWRILAQPDAGRRPTFVMDGQAGRPVLRFDGNAFLVGPDAEAFEATRPKTIVAVVKPADTAANKVVISKYRLDTAGEDGWSVTFSPDAALYAAVKSDREFRATPVYRYQAGRWYVVIVAWDPTTGLVRQRVNGQLLEAASPLSGTLTGNPAPLLVGAVMDHRNEPSEMFRGDLAELIVSDQPLTDVEAITLEAELGQHWAIPVAGCQGLIPCGIGA